MCRLTYCLSSQHGRVLWKTGTEEDEEMVMIEVRPRVMKNISDKKTKIRVGGGRYVVLW